MFKEKGQVKEELDRAGRLILNAAAADEREIEAAASSPFVFTRIRAAIAEERAREGRAGNWLSLILVAKRAVPAMALVAMLAAILTIWPALFGGGATPAQAADEEVLFGPAEPGVEQTVLASRNGLSRDEVFNLVVDRSYEVNGK
jgi:hypothetical protein